MAVIGALRQINWIDVLVLILLVRGSYVGLRRGLLSEIFGIFGIIVALFVSIRYYPEGAQFFSRQAFFSKFPLPVNEGLSFVALLLFVALIFRLGRFIARFAVHFEAGGPLERISALLCGFIRGGIIAGLVLFALNLLPFDYLKKSINEDSLSGSRLIKTGPAIYQTIFKFSPGENKD